MRSRPSTSRTALRTLGVALALAASSFPATAQAPLVTPLRPSLALPNTDTLYGIWQVHVDPGGPPWNTSQVTFERGCFILDEMATVFEAHGLPMFVAVSWNFDSTM